MNMTYLASTQFRCDKHNEERQMKKLKLGN
uniref:Uncharacterized protein n=1 Tax=Rhizophora mucronata TaxID=61149 RepID=A0A2P2QZ27_RHIMU